MIGAALLALAGAAGLVPCRPPGLERDALCGSLQVAERRDRPGGRRIPVAFVVVPAAVEAAPDPVFYIAGGPGQAATRSVAQAVHEHADTLRSRAIVLVDQRGTGGSNRLACAGRPESDIRRYLASGFDLEMLRRCRAELEAKADLTAYTTADAAEDLEAVRAALGYPRLNLDGGSYGTRVALRYMQRHPRRVRAAVLRGVSPASYANPLPFARAGQQALERLFANCGSDAGCARAFPSLPSDFAQVLRRLEGGPVRVEVRNPATGEAQPAELDREVFVTRVHLLLFSSALSARLPYLIHRAASGDFVPFAQLAADFGRAIIEQIDLGMQLSVLCAEDAPLVAAADIDAATSETFLGGGRARQILRACAEWPRGAVPADFRRPVRAALPTLVISGEVDPVTPPRFGEEVVRWLPRGRHLVVPNGSHVDAADCVDRIAAEFVRRGSADGLDTGCLAASVRPPFVLSP